MRTIYRILYVQTRGVLKKELQEYLRSPRVIRRSRYATQKGLELRKIKNAVSISERPAVVEDRAVPWHHCRQGIHSMPEGAKGDLIAGSNNSYMVTLVEYRKFTMATNIDVNFCDPQSPLSSL